MERKDIFKISYENKRILELIPSMMENDLFRKELRELALKFMMISPAIFEEKLKIIKKELQKAGLLK